MESLAVTLQDYIKVKTACELLETENVLNIFHRTPIGSNRGTVVFKALHSITNIQTSNEQQTFLIKRVAFDIFNHIAAKLLDRASGQLHFTVLAKFFTAFCCASFNKPSSSSSSACDNSRFDFPRRADIANEFYSSNEDDTTIKTSSIRPFVKLPPLGTMTVYKTEARLCSNVTFHYVNNAGFHLPPAFFNFEGICFILF